MGSSIPFNPRGKPSTAHNTTAPTGIKSRLPLSQLAQVGVMNTRAGRLRYADGFGDMAPPDPRPRAPIINIRALMATGRVNR